MIAITHMRLPHDLKLAEQVPGIDLVLAGHDHFYKVEAAESKFTSKEEEKKAEVAAEVAQAKSEEKPKS